MFFADEKQCLRMRIYWNSDVIYKNILLLQLISWIDTNALWAWAIPICEEIMSSWKLVFLFQNNIMKVILTWVDFGEHKMIVTWTSLFSVIFSIKNFNKFLNWNPSTRTYTNWLQQIITYNKLYEKGNNRNVSNFIGSQMIEKKLFKLLFFPPR